MSTESVEPATGARAPAPPAIAEPYEYPETRELVALVSDAARLIESKGEAAFADLRVAGSRWRQEETYVFVLDLEGNMLVHIDPRLEGRNQLELKDIRGRPIVRGLLEAATADPEKPEGFYHYEWPVPGGLLPRWKSSYLRLVQGPDGKRFVVGSGMYNDRMEKSFVVDMVTAAARAIQRDGPAAFPLFHDPKGRFLVKDAYVFVYDAHGVEVVNPAQPNLEGRYLLDYRDTQGKAFVREFFNLMERKGSGWVSYMWPKPGDSVSTQKSTYLMKVPVGDTWFMVGAGVYLAEAPVEWPAPKTMTAPELMALVREAAALLETSGEAAFAELRKDGSKWLHDDVYFLVWKLDGTRVLHPLDPALEGTNAGDAKDIRGRPYGRMLLDIAASPSGEGWVHYLYPEPGDIFPLWKSVFVKRVTFPSGEKHLVGCGVYRMKMDKAFIEDLVNRAALLVQEKGTDAFPLLRDQNGPFMFIDTYIFADTPDGTEVLNAGQPSMEGVTVMNRRDLTGKLVGPEIVETALDKGSGWVDYVWYKPGENTPTMKHSFVRRADSPHGTFIVGAGYYAD